MLEVPQELNVAERDAFTVALERHRTEIDERDGKIAELEATLARVRTDAYRLGWQAGREDGRIARGTPSPREDRPDPVDGGMVILRPSSPILPFAVARVMRIDGRTALVKVAGADPFVVAFEDCESI